MSSFCSFAEILATLSSWPWTGQKIRLPERFKLWQLQKLLWSSSKRYSKLLLILQSCKNTHSMCSELQTLYMSVDALFDYQKQS